MILTNPLATLLLVLSALHLATAAPVQLSTGTELQNRATLSKEIIVAREDPSKKPDLKAILGKFMKKKERSASRRDTSVILPPRDEREFQQAIPIRTSNANWYPYHIINPIQSAKKPDMKKIMDMVKKLSGGGKKE